MKNLFLAIGCLALLAPRAALAQGEYDPNSEGLPQDEGAQYAPPPGEPDQLPSDEAPPSEVDFQTFHDSLSPYGNWVNTPEYGWVWVPADSAPTDSGDDWQPYSDGQWLWTSYGWTWSGSEPWAWAPYHYGRWCYLGGVGWCWIPGYVWGPAWVSWRWGPGCVGWTPLAPGYPYGGPWLASYPVYYNQWSFTAAGSFWGGNVRGHLYPTQHVQANWMQTHPIRPAQGKGAVYHGPARSMIAQAVGRPVTAVDIHPVASPALAGFHPAGATLNVYAPRFQAATHPFAVARGGIAPTVSATQPRGIGSLVHAGPPRSGGGAVGVLGGRPAPGGPVAAPIPAGVQPHHGAPAPGSGSHGPSGGGRAGNHPEPQSLRSEPRSGTFSTYHSREASPVEREPERSYAPYGSSQASGGSYASQGATRAAHGSTSGTAYGGYGNYRPARPSQPVRVKPAYAATTHPAASTGSSSTHAAVSQGGGSRH